MYSPFAPSRYSVQPESSEFEGGNQLSLGEARKIIPVAMWGWV